MSVMFESFCRPVEPIESTAKGSDPKNTGMVFEDAPDIIIAQAPGVTGIVSVVGEVIRFSVQLVQPPICHAQPQKAFAIFINRTNNLVAQAIRVIGIGTVADKFLAKLIYFVESANFGPKPENGRAILVKRQDVVRT